MLDIMYDFGIINLCLKKSTQDYNGHVIEDQIKAMQNT
jgi:hypothetical protein